MGSLDCPEGRWGLGCQEICPTCEHGGSCDPETGACLCRPGFVGSRCQDGECHPAWAPGPAWPLALPPTHILSAATVCPAGWFGAGCQTRCSCANDGHCHPTTGRCSCAPGWTGLHCQQGGALVRASWGQFWDARALTCRALALLQLVPRGAGDLTAASRATAVPATGAATRSAACACVRLATWAHGASSVSLGPALGVPMCAHCFTLALCLPTQHELGPLPYSLGQGPTFLPTFSDVQLTWSSHVQGGVACLRTPLAPVGGREVAVSN